MNDQPTEAKPEQPKPVTPESLAEEYCESRKYVTEFIRARDRHAFLAGYRANAERNAGIAQRLDLAEEALLRHGFELGVVKDVVAWVPNPSREPLVVGGELVQSTGLDAVHRYKLIVQDLTPEIWKEFQAEESTVSWRCLALNSISKIKHENVALKTAAADYAKAAEASAVLVEKLIRDRDLAQLDRDRLSKGVLTTLRYPRGSEAQIRCLEEVSEDAKEVPQREWPKVVLAEAYDALRAEHESSVATIERLTREREEARAKVREFDLLPETAEAIAALCCQLREENEALNGKLTAAILGGAEEIARLKAIVNNEGPTWGQLRAELSAAREESANLDGHNNDLQTRLTAANAARENACKERDDLRRQLAESEEREQRECNRVGELAQAKWETTNERDEALATSLLTFQNNPMMETIQFFAQGIPKGQPRPKAFARGGHAAVYDPGTAEGWKGQVALAARPFLKALPSDHPPLSLRLDFYMPRPKAHFHTGRFRDGVLRESSPKYHTGKPDADNLAKAVMDALTQLNIWRDDACVVDLRVKKLYATNEAGCSITIAESAE